MQNCLDFFLKVNQDFSDFQINFIFLNQVAGQHDKEHGVWSILEGMIAMGWSIVSNIPENILFLVFIENKKIRIQI